MHLDQTNWSEKLCYRHACLLFDAICFAFQSKTCFGTACHQSPMLARVGTCQPYLCNQLSVSHVGTCQLYLYNHLSVSCQWFIELQVHLRLACPSLQPPGAHSRPQAAISLLPRSSANHDLGSRGLAVHMRTKGLVHRQQRLACAAQEGCQGPRHALLRWQCCVWMPVCNLCTSKLMGRASPLPCRGQPPSIPPEVWPAARPESISCCTTMILS